MLKIHNIWFAFLKYFSIVGFSGFDYYLNFTKTSLDSKFHITSIQPPFNSIFLVYQLAHWRLFLSSDGSYCVYEIQGKPDQGALTCQFNFSDYQESFYSTYLMTHYEAMAKLRYWVQRSTNRDASKRFWKAGSDFRVDSAIALGFPTQITRIKGNVI